MKHIMNDISEMMSGFEQELPLTTDFPDQKTRNLRIKLLMEEFHEYIDAEMDSDMVEISDALGDMIVIIIGTALSYGIPLDKIWNEIHKSNMAKIDEDTGKVIRRDDGKVIKPESWTPPDIQGILYD